MAASNTRDLLLEIGVEEMPALYMPAILDDLKERARTRLAEARLDYAGMDVIGTPRRLVLKVESLSEQQPEARIENRGPKKAAAFDAEGKPTRAAEGFARSQGLAVGDLEIKDSDGTEYLYAIKTVPGQAAEIVLESLLPELILALPFPKSMRWAYYPVRFGRPIRWLVALFGSSVVSFEIAGVASGRTSMSHRFLGAGTVSIPEPGAYRELMRENYVIVDHRERETMIWQQIQGEAARAGGFVAENEELLTEINFLVEYPTAFTGTFSPSYLDVPVEVLTTSMIENQRYFPVFDGSGKLLPNFISVRNGLAEYMENVIAGNERVLRARLEDALFFWKEDTKKPLEAMNEGLERVMFHARLGNLKDKVERMRVLAVKLGQMSGFSDPVKLDRAAELCKADLLSSMVYEFPELQGIMGRYYARKSGEDPEVAEALMELYMPRSTGAEIPATETGCLLALAEKFDNLTGFFAVGMRPSGAQDPYALRRNAFGIIGILSQMPVNMDLSDIIGSAYASFGANSHLEDLDSCREAIIDFIMQRLRGQLIEQGYGFDVVDAVLAVSRNDIKDIITRIQVLQDARGGEVLEDLMVAYNRANNLSKKWDDTAVRPELFADPAEGDLYAKLLAVAEKSEELLQRRDYAAVLKSLASMRPEADTFFEAVMVMVDDVQVRANRLGLLKQIAQLFRKVAEFSILVNG